ncbi:MAG: hypothetical protein JNM66_08355 [Bryobacterales bacterium]|nr:hypothetical protein [Bryobacterales bacterium]
MLQLRIELLSPLCPASGLDRPGIVDRDIVFDSLGLPYLPARRVKGVLREVYGAVFHGLKNLPQSPPLPHPDSAFGRIGQPRSGPIVFRSAVLSSAPEISPWLAAFLARDPAGERRARVMNAFCEIRRQTAMNRESGGPDTDTLRATRTLRTGLVFLADLELPRDPSLVWALALAAAALRSMGSSRNRGLGEVSCTLLSNGADLTHAALDALSSQGFQAPALPQSPAPAARPAPPATSGAVELRFELTLQQPAVFPSLRGDPNTVASQDYIPGSVIHGAIASRFLDNSGFGPEFQRLFTSSAVSFSNAYPVVAAKPLLPVPHAIRKSKDPTSGFLDLTRELSGPGIARLGGFCDFASLTTANILYHSEVPQSLHYHHDRAANPLLQRAVGVEKAAAFGLDPELAGTLFSYQSIDAGQTFTGSVRGPADLLASLVKLVDDGDTLRLGRSKTAQYGGHAAWRWTTQTPGPAIGADTSDFTVVLTAPLSTFNDRGHPCARFPVDELAAELSNPGLTLIKQFSRAEWHGGYLAHQRFPRQQIPALSPGTVLVFHSDRPLTAKALKSAASKNYGVRREQGFGSIEIVPRNTLTLDRIAAGARRSQLSAAPPSPASQEFSDRLFTESVEILARRHADGIASRLTGPLPAKSLLHRLLKMLLAAPSPQDFQNQLDRLRPRARQQLEKCRGADGKLLQILAESPRVIASRVAEEEFRMGDWKPDLPAGRPPVDDRVGTLFLSELLYRAAKRSAKESKNG